MTKIAQTAMVVALSGHHSWLLSKIVVPLQDEKSINHLTLHIAIGLLVCSGVAILLTDSVIPVCLYN